MLTPCEIAVKSVIPAIRAYVAKELIQTHKMKQTDVANLLGITQTAVSKYVGNVRGRAIEIDQKPEIQKMMNEVASNMAEHRISGPELTLKFCAICRTVRKDGIMCGLCAQFNPTLDIAECSMCKQENR